MQLFELDDRMTGMHLQKEKGDLALLPECDEHLSARCGLTL